MCFKKPKAPVKTQEDVAAERELDELRKVRQAQLNNEISDAKDRRVDDQVARATGFMGNRSLIKGGKGGAGFMGQYQRKAKTNTPAAPRNEGIAPSAPPIMSSPYVGGGSGGSLFSYYNGNTYGGYYDSNTYIGIA